MKKDHSLTESGNQLDQLHYTIKIGEWLQYWLEN